jgi:molybdenum cofactor cytidylyltransferase
MTATPGETLPVVAPPFEAEGDPPRVNAVLLAAGTSSRYGTRNKLVEPVDGEPVVRRAARTLLEGPVDRVVVVLGYEADRVGEALAGLAVETVHNDDYGAGQSTSVRAGLRAARPGVDALVVALGDMPFVRPGSVARLVEAYHAGAGRVLAAACDGVRGNPVLFDAALVDELLSVEGDVGGRGVLFDRDDAALVETGDPGVRHDVDRPEDLPGDGSLPPG